MSKLKCGCVIADAKNTASVRNGSEMGGYVKHSCPKHDPRRQKPLAPGEYVNGLYECRAGKGEQSVILHHDGKFWLAGWEIALTIGDRDGTSTITKNQIGRLLYRL